MRSSFVIVFVAIVLTCRGHTNIHSLAWDKLEEIQERLEYLRHFANTKNQADTHLTTRTTHSLQPTRTFFVHIPKVDFKPKFGIIFFFVYSPFLFSVSLLTNKYRKLYDKIKVWRHYTSTSTLPGCNIMELDIIPTMSSHYHNTSHR
jgi:hypothetical protein